MKIIEQSAERLVFRTGLPLLKTSRCEFDRRSGRAVIKRMAVMWPRKTVDVSLTDIVAVDTWVVNNTMESTQVSTAIPQIVLASGKRVNLSVLTADTKTAPKALAAMKAFLKL